MLTIIIGNTKCKLFNLRDPEVIKELDQQLSYTIQGHQFVRNNNGWDGRQRLFTKNHYFPIGLLPRVINILKKHKCPFDVKDNREEINYGEPLEIDPSSDFTPRDYQQHVVDIAWERGSGVIRVATGGGKTGILSMITAKFNVRTVIYVIGIELLYQMKETIEKLYPQIKVGMVGDGHCDIQPITIATIWSAGTAFGKKNIVLDNDLTAFSKSKDKLSASNKEKIKQMVREAELLILDECQYASAETFVLLHKESMAAKHRFLLSGTPWRSDGADLLIEATGGPKIYNLDASTLIKRNILVPPKIFFLPVPKMRGAGQNYQEVYKNYITENKERNDMIVKSVHSLVKQKRKVLILVSQINHSKILLERLQDDFKVASLDGSNNTNERLSNIQKMKNGELDVMLASRIFDQGVDIPILDALILAGSGKSSGRALQRIGRVIRGCPGKKDAIVIDFLDDCRYLKEHSKIRKKIYETEELFKVIVK
jgi:superfamily II DNA or RNA helicase